MVSLLSSQNIYYITSEISSKILVNPKFQVDIAELV